MSRIAQLSHGTLQSIVRAVPAAPRVSARQCAATIVVCGVAYGAVMGSLNGFAGDRLLQVVYSAVKVPLLLGVTSAVCVPSFFVLNSLLGVRNDLAIALRALLAGQAGLAVVLASLAPYTALWYCSSAEYTDAIAVNGAMFAIASAVGQFVLRRHYAPLIARDRRHRQLLNVWLGMYVFVAIQLAWVLRPFVGTPGQATQFFRESAWDNAYVIVARLVWGLFAD
ncbi:MAG: hypothetical protein AB7U73_04920 [Pirellulales bacterium]